ncbi:Hsp70 chaperone protein [Fusarium circinatum]|uniref:Hsp70 chaperone protein n=1 Tax=Fusarium circinatum TaxID=48490 RepID=A0A8H5TPB1_FUSCI|nr:Hsp70 chaperone protein [Fusarium circinatum]
MERKNSRKSRRRARSKRTERVSWSTTDRLHLLAYLEWCVEHCVNFEITAPEYLENVTGRHLSKERVRQKLYQEWQTYGICGKFNDLFELGTAGLSPLIGVEQEIFRKMISSIIPAQEARRTRGRSLDPDTRSSTLSVPRSIFSISRSRESAELSTPKAGSSSAVPELPRQQTKAKPSLEPTRRILNDDLSEDELAGDNDTESVQAENRFELSSIASTELSDIELSLAPARPKSQTNSVTIWSTPTMDAELIIRNKSQVCKEAFQTCLKIQDLAEDDWLEQKSAEFNWWISGLNADKIGPGSLDSRLMLRPDVKEVVVDLLESLIIALSEYEDIAEAEEKEEAAEDGSLEEFSSDSQHLTTDELNRTPSPWSDMTDGTGTEARTSTEGENEKADGDLYWEQKFYIETNIEILLRIHAAIKKSGPKFMNQRADDDLARAEEKFQHEKSRLGEHEAVYGSDPSIGEHERFRRFLTRLVLQNGYKEGLLRSIEGNIQRFSIDHGPETNDHPYLSRQRKLLVVFKACLYDPSRLTPIQRRLINANIVRRNRLIHAGNAEKARSRIEQEEPQLPQRLSIAKEVTQESQIEERRLDQRGRIPPAAPSYSPPIPTPISRKSFVSQTVPRLGSNFSNTTDLMPMKKTESAAAKMSARVATIDYPECPASKGPFPCPYCPLTLSHAYTERTKWRAHVAQDLCAYVCIFEDCESPDDMYTSTYEWMSHMARYHSAMQWVCTECSKHGQSSVEKASIHSFKDPLDLKAHILSLHPEMDESEVDLMVQAGSRPVGIQRVACPLCRPGIVSNATGEGDKTPVDPESCVEEIGLVHLEEDEHIATHIHEFSLHAFPWSCETKTQDKSEMSISNATASTRHQVVVPGSGIADPIFEIKTYLHNQEEVLDNLQDLREEPLPLSHAHEEEHLRPERIKLDLLDEDRGDPFPKRLIIAVDFGTTYSTVSYVDVLQGYASDSVDPRSIRSIGNYPDTWHYYDDPMGAEVPTEVIYPLDRHFRDHFNLDNPDEELKSGDSSKMPAHEADSDISMLSDVSQAFRWGYQVYEIWNRPSTHSNTNNQPLSRFKLLLDDSQMAEWVKRDLRHQGFDDSYEKEMILCVPARWTQKACRDMQACLAVAMKRANFTRADLQNKSIDNLFIVSEPEAAAAHMLSTSAEIKAGDCFVLLDAGGGIVNASTYRVSREKPLRLETEIVAPGGMLYYGNGRYLLLMAAWKGGLHGSSYLNEGFQCYLESLLHEETYLNDGIETIHGIIQRITYEEFEKKIKRDFDYKLPTAKKEIYIRGLRDNPAKGFRNECLYIPRLKIQEIFFKHLDAIVEIVKGQLEVARGKGYTIGKVVLIGGFGTSISLRHRLQEFLMEYDNEHSCPVTLMEPQQGTSIINAVASGAVLRALNKANGPERIARSSYGILRTEPFKEYSEHEGLRPSYDRHDGMPYIKNTIDWVLKLGEIVPSVWQCEPFACSHTFDVWPVRPFICREMLYVSDHATKSHYRKTHPNNEGAEYVGEIEVDFSSLRDRLVPIEPIVNKNQQKVGKRHYRIDFTMAIKVVDRDLECFAIHDQKDLDSISFSNVTLPTPL